MAGILVALLIIVPFAELAVIIKVSDLIGLVPTLLLLVAVSVAGGLLLKREGVSTWRRLRAALNRGEMPTEEVSDGALILLGGALLLTPGFITDVFGFTLLFPITRRVWRRSLRALFGMLAFKRLGRRGRAAMVGRRVYNTRATRVDRKQRPSAEGRGTSSSSPPQPLPSGARPAGEHDSPDRE